MLHLLSVGSLGERGERSDSSLIIVITVVAKLAPRVLKRTPTLLQICVGFFCHSDSLSDVSLNAS